MKRARDGGGCIVRVQNIGGADETGTLSFPNKRIARAWRTDLLERNLEPLMPSADGSLRIEAGAYGLATVRIAFDENGGNLA